MGQPIEIETAWKNLITKSVKIGVDSQVFAKCLRKKFQHFNASKDLKFRMDAIVWMKFPPGKLIDKQQLFDLLIWMDSFQHQSLKYLSLDLTCSYVDVIHVDTCWIGAYPEGNLEQEEALFDMICNIPEKLKAISSILKLLDGA